MKTVYTISMLLNYDEVDLIDMSNEEFKDICKDEGRVYDLEDFQEAFNSGEVTTNVDYIRIL